MYTDLKDKVAIVTGAATGLGLEISKRLLSEGMKVVIDYIGSDKVLESDAVQDVKNTYGDSVIFFEADVSNEDEIAQLAQTAIDKFGGFDLWVNNAGVEKAYATADLPLDEWNRVMDVNMTGVFLGTREALRHFTKSGKKGNIINMSSVHQQIPWPTFAHYAASKGGTKMFTETVALEYADKGIRVNNIAPCAIDTPINAAKFEDPKQKAQTQAMVPMGEIGKPKYVADAAAFLASEQAQYITGTTLFVDGGMSLYPAFQHGAG